MEEVRIKYVSFKFIEKKKEITKQEKIYLILCRVGRCSIFCIWGKKIIEKKIRCKKVRLEQE